MQPTDVPENCEFIVGDLTETLADFDTGSFDLVHSRYPHYSPRPPGRLASFVSLVSLSPCVYTQLTQIHSIRCKEGGMAGVFERSI